MSGGGGLIYRREIDGLRAVAVIPVILFHADLGLFSGGYLGVDIFFVISGYLITGILHTDIEQGQFSLARFYERRARRLLPALFLVLLCCLPFAWLWMLPGELKDFSQSLIATVVMASNVLLWRQGGYFAGPADTKPLLHTWSLAVEEQFYLFFPLFLLLTRRLGRRHLFWTVATLAAASLAASEWAWRHEPYANFYLAPTRAWELLAGCLCALWLADREPRASNALSLLGLAMIAIPMVSYDRTTPVPSVFALVPVLGTVLLILFGSARSWGGRLLGMRGFVGLGLISYSAYLWHQPLLAFARIRSIPEPPPGLIAALAVLSLVLAYATWRYVETPFRRTGFRPLATRRAVFTASGAMAILLLGIGLAGVSGQASGLRGTAPVLERLEARLGPNYGLGMACEQPPTIGTPCRTSPQPELLLWGDSFSMQLVHGLMASDPGVALQQHSMSGCPPIAGLALYNPPIDQTASFARRCIDFNERALNWLKHQGQVRTVVLTMALRAISSQKVMTRDGMLHGPGDTALVRRALIATVRRIRATGARVLIVSPTPSSGRNNGQCVVRATMFGRSPKICDFRYDPAKNLVGVLQSLPDDIPVYWLKDDICPLGECRAMQDDRIIVRDTGHLSKEGSAYLGRKHDWTAQFKAQAR